MNTKLFSLLFATALALLPFSSPAQDEGAFVFALGTTRQDAQARSWGWIILNATRNDLLQGQNIAIFRKPGAADAIAPYTLESVTGVQTDPRVIELLIQRGAQLGGDPDELLADVASLFRGLNLDPSLTRAEKILAVIVGSQQDQAQFDNLLWLARKHPALALCIGIGHATLLPPGPSTFELRSWNAAEGAAGEVLGRVTLSPGDVRVLPAPANLVHLPDDSPRGDLNVPLAWTVPDALRRVSLLQFGFNLYRMDADYAEENGLHITPPTPAALVSLVNLEKIHRVNRLPILINDVLQPGDPLFVDDNNRFDAGGDPFNDGDRFYYFVTARDLLGRDGLASTPVEVTVCARMPLPPPRQLTLQPVRQFDPGTGVARDILRLRWRQIVLPNPDVEAFYAVYRENNGDYDLIAEDIPHVPGDVHNSIDDPASAGAPATELFTYVVQAYTQTACGRLSSQNSPPGHGNLPNWEGPPPPAGDVRIRCLELDIVNKPLETVAVADPQDLLHADVRKAADAEEIEWAEVRWIPGALPGLLWVEDASSLGIRHFANAANEVRFSVPTPPDSQITLFSRVGRGLNETSKWVWQVVSVPKDSPRTTAVFRGERTYAWGIAGEDCDTHEFPGPDDPPSGPGDPEGPGPQSEFGPVPAGHSWRLYREVNGGTRSLVGSGTTLAEGLVLLADDVRGAPTCARICYYVAVLDPDGNASPLRRLGCYATRTRTPPAPELNAPRAQGSAAEPNVELGWFAPPYGVEFFQVWVGMETPVPQNLSPELSANLLPPGSRRVFIVDGVQVELFAGAYLTRRVGLHFGEEDSADFALSFPVELNRRYVFSVNSTGLCDDSDLAEALTFTWASPDEGPEVVWPARPLPDVTPGAIAGMQAKLIAGPTSARVGIRVGRLPYVPPPPPTFGGGPLLTIYGFNGNPMQFLYQDTNGKNMFPFLLYRVQVSSTARPNVSGSVVQVSPLIEGISHQISGPNTLLRDPFFHAVPDEENPNAAFGDLYVLDTQPVLRGAKYQYFLLQLSDRFEPLRVLPLNQVEIPE